MLEKQRQRLILDILAEENYASVTSLTQRLNSSEATIRRDINKLAKQSLLSKIRGGAEHCDSHNKDNIKQKLNSSNFLLDKEKNSSAKREIAKAAVDLCEEGESIIINGGSSTFMMSEFLSHRSLNILTNSFFLAYELIETDNTVFLPGGEIYRSQGIVLSAFENDMIMHYHGNKMFMGSPGIGNFGVMESDPQLIRSEQKLMKQADQLIILADSTKLGRRSNLILCGLEDVDILITDSFAPDKILNLFEREGIKVIQVCTEEKEL